MQPVYLPSLVGFRPGTPGAIASWRRGIRAQQPHPSQFHPSTRQHESGKISNASRSQPNKSSISNPTARAFQFHKLHTNRTDTTKPTCTHHATNLARGIGQGTDDGGASHASGIPTKLATAKPPAGPSHSKTRTGSNPTSDEASRNACSTTTTKNCTSQHKQLQHSAAAIMDMYKKRRPLERLSEMGIVLHGQKDTMVIDGLIKMEGPRQRSMGKEHAVDTGDMGIKQG